MQKGGRGRVHPLDIFNDPRDRCRFECQSDDAGYFLVKATSPSRWIDTLFSIRGEVLELGQQVANSGEGLQVRRRSPGDVSGNRAEAIDHGTVGHVCLGWIATAFEQTNILEGDRACELAYESGFPDSGLP